ncbi:MAG TPA: DoxX family membrane protein [bacterium]|nr:DoxX family membrane protein [bacterium]
MEKLLVFVGRTIYSLPFLGFGAGHLMNADKMKGMVPGMFPGGAFWIYFTGVAMILAALAIITGKQGRAACFGLALMLLVFIATVHLPGLADPPTQMMSLMGLYKDTGLLGGALVIASTFKSKA